MNSKKEYPVLKLLQINLIPRLVAKLDPDSIGVVPKAYWICSNLEIGGVSTPGLKSLSFMSRKSLMLFDILFLSLDYNSLIWRK